MFVQIPHIVHLYDVIITATTSNSKSNAKSKDTSKD